MEKSVAMTNNLDQIGAQVAKLLKEAKEQNETALTKANDLLAERHAKVKPLLEKVWTAFDNKQTVNGCATKGAFAKSVGYSRRALEYIVYGRPEKKKKDANSCSHGTLLKDGVLIKSERNGEVYRIEGEIRARATKGDRLVISFTAIEASRALPKKQAKSPVKKEAKTEAAKKHAADTKAAKKNGSVKIPRLHWKSSEGKNTTRCAKPITAETQIVNMKEAVTCGNCQTSIDTENRREAYYAEHPHERNWWAHSNTEWRNSADGRFIYKTPRKEEYKVYAKGTKTDTPVATVTTLKEAMAVGMKMHPAAEALAAVVGSPDCPPETEEVV